MSYWFNVQESTNQQAAGLGLGYYVGYNGSEMGAWSMYYNLGVASDGSTGGAVVPWGNVAAYPRFMARSSIYTQIAGGLWGAGMTS